jgi:hypothetical protein
VQRLKNGFVHNSAFSNAERAPDEYDTLMFFIDGFIIKNSGKKPEPIDSGSSDFIYIYIYKEPVIHG